MFPIALSIFGGLITAMYLAASVPTQHSQVVATNADVLAANFLSYRSSVVRYVNSNPTATGTILDSQMVFPVGYVRNSAWTNRLIAGQWYVYSIGLVPSAGLVSATYRKAGKGPFVGISVAGHLENPGVGNIGVSIPAIIPDGSLVMVGL